MKTILIFIVATLFAIQVNAQDQQEPFVSFDTAKIVLFDSLSPYDYIFLSSNEVTDSVVSYINQMLKYIGQKQKFSAKFDSISEVLIEGSDYTYVDIKGWGTRPGGYFCSMDSVVTRELVVNLEYFTGKITISTQHERLTMRGEGNLKTKISESFVDYGNKRCHFKKVEYRISKKEMEDNWIRAVISTFHRIKKERIRSDIAIRKILSE